MHPLFPNPFRLPFSPKIFRAAALAASALLIPSVASAQFDTTYSAGSCIGSGKEVEALFQHNSGYRYQNLIFNPTSSPIQVECPIIKHTSGPAIKNGDAVHTVTITGAPAAGPISCTVHIWRSSLVRDGASPNETFEYTGSGSFPAPIVISIPFPINDFWGNSANYFQGLPGQTVPNWEYSDMECTLPPGGYIQTYKVHEDGPTQTSRIFPIVNCSQDTNATGFWGYQTPAGTPESNTGGYLYFNAEDITHKHLWHCPVPDNVSVEFAVLPSAPANVNGCSLDAFPTASGWTWKSTVSTGQAAPWQTLPLPGQPGILVPPTGKHELICGEQLGGDGDGSLISYRTILPQSRSGWTASASVSNGGEPPSQALDANLTNRWSTGHPQANGQYFQVDMGSARPIRQIVMSANGGGLQDYPRGYKVYLSTSGTDWATQAAVATGTGTTPVISARFAAKNARYIRIVQTGTSTSWWSIYDFNVYQ